MSRDDRYRAPLEDRIAGALRARPLGLLVLAVIVPFSLLFAASIVTRRTEPLMVALSVLLGEFVMYGNHGAAVAAREDPLSPRRTVRPRSRFTNNSVR